MSDQLDSTQPGADPLADRLRALGADTSRTASMPSVDEIHRGGDRRRRTQRLTTIGATLAVAAVVGGAVVASQLRGPVDDTLLPATQSPTASATPSPTKSAPDPTPSTTGSAESPSATPSGLPTPTAGAVANDPYAGRRVDVGGRATVLVPAGWTSTARSHALVDEGEEVSVPMLCLEDGRPNGPSTQCDLEIQWGPMTVGAEGMTAWTPGESGGWYHRSDAAACPLPGGDPTAYGQTDIVRSDQVPARSFGPVGTKTAEVYRYAVDCTQGRSFTSTMWWLPTTQLRFHDVVGNDRVKDILASVRFDGE